MGQAVLAQFEADFGVGQEAPEKVTYIPLDGEGTVDVRVEKSVRVVFLREWCSSAPLVFRLFKAYLSRPDWIRDVRRADAVFVAAHVSFSASIHPDFLSSPIDIAPSVTRHGRRYPFTIPLRESRSHPNTT